MALQVNAVYDGGVLRPLKPLDLAEHERVVVSVSKIRETLTRSSLDVEYIERLKEKAGEGSCVEQEDPGLDEVRRRLAGIPGSMASEILAARGER
jgi:predicted DNA-binding antitoxin AbrB/MazE fold protein